MSHAQSAIRVASGKFVDLANVRPSDIDLPSIAASLSKLCRFNGHCPKFYSVAEHSILAAKLALRDSHERPVCRAVFLHDAAEAYVGDVTRPLKNIIRSVYGPVEESASLAVSERFGVDFVANSDLIRHYDDLALSLEQDVMWRDSSAVQFAFWLPPEAELNFLLMANCLDVS